MNPSQATVVNEFNPNRSQNLFRQKSIEIERRLLQSYPVPPGTTFTYTAANPVYGPADVLGLWRFPQDEYMQQQWIQRIDMKGAFNDTYNPTGWERAPSGRQLLPGYYSGYLNIVRNKEYIIQDMPLFFLDSQSPSNLFRNFNPFQIDFHDSFVRMAAFHQPLQVQNGFNPLRDDVFQTVEQDLSMLFNMSYIPVDTEFKDTRKDPKTAKIFNPYEDQNLYRVKFIEVPIARNYFGRHYFPIDRDLDTRWIHRIITIDPYGLLKRTGQNSNAPPPAFVNSPDSVFGFSTTAAGAISPNGRAMLWGNRSAYVNIISKSTTVQERIPLSSLRDGSFAHGYRNFVPFQIDLARSFIEIPNNQSSNIADPFLAPGVGQDPTNTAQPECCIMLGICYLPDEVAERYSLKTK